MKLNKLFLKAFGPFTNTTLDFSGPANLHVIYGPNEAGKSSALRAMADLRYGIHSRSGDDFIHSFKDLLLAANFEDGAGRSVSLARRKGNKDTLLMADPMQGEPMPGSHVAPDVLLALTGGVGRDQFETMYGLDSEHLRRGGQQLIQGEGELGAALFEASTGAAGIRALLTTLQTDAKKLFAVRAQSPLLNEAARQLDEARQRYKQSITKPDQWKALNRAHEEAVTRLATVRTQLAQNRRRLAELAELRAVEPLLRQLDLTETEWANVQGHVALHTDARQNRLAALQQKAQAESSFLESKESLDQCQKALAALKMEAPLLNHASVIDGLVSDLDMVRRTRDAHFKLIASTESEAGQLMLQATRIVGPATLLESLEALFIQTPSAATQADVEELLEQHKTLTQALQHAKLQLQNSAEKLAQLQRDPVEEPAPELQQSLALALSQAHLLGDAEKRLADLQTVLVAEQRKLDRAVADLGLASIEQLTASRWLASAAIDAYERDRIHLQQHIALDADNLKKLGGNLEEQKRRRSKLAATGEVVTANTLRQARTLRDQSWRGIREIFIDEATGSGAKPFQASHLPQAFEHAQTDADRQADLLREGAQRAAEMAEAEQRIGEMTAALSGYQASGAAQQQALKALDDEWRKTLVGLGLPNGSAAALREWLALRLAALELNERQTQAAQASELLKQQIAAAVAVLLAPLVALERAPSGTHHRLAALLAIGQGADRDLVAARTARQHRLAGITTMALEIQKKQAEESALTNSLMACRAALDEKCHRLCLGEGASADAIKARFIEFQNWTHDYQRHVGQLTQVRQARASEDLVASQAKALAALLQESAGDHTEAWLDGLCQRLALSQTAQTTQLGLNQRKTEESQRQTRAQQALETALQTLALLMQQASVQTADELLEAEQRSEGRHQTLTMLKTLRHQVASTSRKDADTLRAELLNLDSVALDAEKQNTSSHLDLLEVDEKAAIAAEQTSRAALAEVDTSDDAAQAREEMESAIARYRAGVRPWAQLKLAEALLSEALRRYREKAQGPVVELGSAYFELMTGGRFVRLLVEDDGDHPVLMAQPSHGQAVAISALSEGTADQLHLALRLAALQVQRQPDRMMPLVLDDVFMTSDDARASNVFRALAKFAEQGQVLVFTHHRHLMDIAAQTVKAEGLRVHQLTPAFGKLG